MTNKHLGYVYLVDEKCKIRWAAVSFAHVEEEGPGAMNEVQALTSCISVLLQRLRSSREAEGVSEAKDA